MSHRLPSPLPLFDRNLLRIVEKVVPRAEREEWSRAWEAELWHMHHCGSPRRTSIAGITADFSIGLTRDALWLRTESWRHTFSGTAILCLALLFGLLLLSTMVALILNGSCYLLGIYLRDPFGRFLLEAPLIFVTFAAASRSHIEQSSASRRMCWIRRQIFFIHVEREYLLAHPCALSCCRGVASNALFRHLHDYRPALGFLGSGAPVQALPPLTCHTCTCRPPLAQPSGMERHRVDL